MRLNIGNSSPIDLHSHCNLCQNVSRFCPWVEIDKLRIKCVWKCRGPRIAQTVWRTLLDVKTYCKAMVTKSMWCWHKDRCLDQWCRRKSPEINPQICAQLICIPVLRQ